MYKKILIANRGEIAIRVISACKEMGISTVAVHSTADAESMHVRLSDESICIGPPASAKSYLNVPAIIAAAELSGAEAIHPGYGFLSEDHRFVEQCTDSGIDFIGPSAESIRLMGDKIEGRRMAEEAGTPVTPGSKQAITSESEARAIAKELGFPVIIKAAAGGGGRGMRIVRSAGNLMKSYSLARTEAESFFGNDGVFIERYIEEPRHIEAQLIGDKFGNIVYLGERDCSIQRRNQKIIEEAPAPHVDEALRQRIGDVSIALAKRLGYFSAGTIEYLMDNEGNFYFMEMNTRLQVEHPVTELVTGVNLVKEQIRVAAGEKLSFTQEDITLQGHSIECRINAEDPYTFAPSPGKIVGYYAPGGHGVRVDSFAHQDCVVNPHYDSMIGKLIVYGKDRDEATAKMIRALEQYIITGIKTSIPLQIAVLKSMRYQKGELHTGFLKNFVKL